MKTAKRKTPRLREGRPLSYTARERSLLLAIQLCFGMVTNEEDKVDCKDIANRSLLSLSTIQRLRRGGGSLRCRFNTIESLGRACGVELTLTPTGTQLYLTDK